MPEILEPRLAVGAAFNVPDSGRYLDAALTHPSFANESRDTNDNQRLEFLGDAILQLCVSELLWMRYPQASEGELTRRRSQLVNTDSLAEFARRNGVPSALRVGRGAEASGIRESNNVLADAVEALIAAAYLDAGLDAASAVCAKLVDWCVEREHGSQSDPKTELQELAQARGHGTPVYELTGSGGPAHARWFRVVVRVMGQRLAEGTGRSKRLAERAAAENALSEGWEAALERLDTTGASP